MSEINDNAFLNVRKPVILTELIYEILKRWYLILAIVIVSMTISFVHTLFFVTPMYESNAKIYIVNKDTPSQSSSDFSISTYLTRDFAAIISDKVVLDKVAEDLDHKYSSGQLKSFINIITNDTTRIIEISVISPNAIDSKNIADSVCRISEDKLVEIMGLDRVKTIRNGSLANHPVSPNISRQVTYGVVIGLIISFILVFVIYMLNDKINSAKDVEKYLEISVLATIPYNHNKLRSR